MTAPSTTTLRQLIMESRDGEWGQSDNFQNSVEMAVIRGTDFEPVRLGSLDGVPVRHVSRHIAERKMLRSYDIVIETAGGTKGRSTGRTLLIKPSTIAKSGLPLTCASFSRFVRVDPNKADPVYVFWVLQYLHSAGHMMQYNTQHTGVSRFQFTIFAESEPLMCPPLPIQRKIAAVLSAYDDLIENNIRRIKILEEMAQVIYREWFVHFRFPGHEKTKMVDSEMGKIPEGWEVMPIGQAVETLGGGTPSTKNPEYWKSGDITWFTPSDLTSNAAMFISDSAKKINAQGLENSSARMFPPYSVMMTSRATIGVTAINTRPACTNQGFVICVPNERVSFHQLYFWIKENKEMIVNVASGATYKEISRSEFREFLIAVADKDKNLLFVEILTPIGKQIENLLAKNANLYRTRDLLLPKLISGEVDVSKLDIDEGKAVT